MPDPHPVVTLARIPRRPPRIDVALAGGLLVWALLEALLVAGPGTPATRVLAAVAFTVPLVLRRRHAALVLALVVGALVVRGALSTTPEEGAMPFPALLVATFSAALYARPEALAVIAAPLGLSGLVAAALLEDFAGSPTPVDLAIGAFFVAGAWTGGWLVRRRAAQLAQARAEGPELAREAVGAERARIARELHDVVAHSVSIIAVQAGAAGELLDRDPARARPHLDAVRETAHEALVELRRLVGVLREDDAVLAPQPGLAAVDELVAEARAAGVPVELAEDGERPSLPAGLDLAAYRIVQESLTNVRRHAGPAPTTVRIRQDGGVLELEVANVGGRPDDAVGPGSGHGLIGMRERARLYGGTLGAGARPGGGFRVHARLPLEEADA